MTSFKIQLQVAAETGLPVSFTHVMLTKIWLKHWKMQHQKQMFLSNALL